METFVHTQTDAISTLDLTHQQWEAYHALLNEVRGRYYQHLDPIFRKMTLEAFRERTLIAIGTLRATEFVFFDPLTDKPYCWLRYYSGNDDLVFSFDVLADAIAPELRRTLAEFLLRALESGQYRRVYTVTQDNRLVSALREMQPYSDVCLRLMEFDAENAPMELLAKWAGIFDQMDPPLQLRFCHNRPDDILEAYVALNDQLIRDMPIGRDDPNYASSWTVEALQRLNENNRRSNSQGVYSLFAFNPAGEMVAMTEMNVRYQPLKMIQGITGVRADYRGHSLSRALKAKMFQHLLEIYPEPGIITTTTGPHNAAMLHVNTEMGFKVVRDAFEFGFRDVELRKYLAG
ncbi:MAG: hypothetical protein AAF570_25075 [Bacteroidota bacterium]